MATEKIKVAVEDLSVSYGSHRAVMGVSLKIFQRSVLALIGPSGCGKSTFLRALNRMNELIPMVKTEGQVSLDGVPIYNEGINLPDLRRRVGMVFQRPNPFPMSIYENVAFGPRRQGIKGREKLDILVEESLRGAALWDEVRDRLYKPALGLSGGQQQRLCIARALAVGPEVLLMDEPASALDPISTAKIEDLITRLKQEYTIVIVTHNMHQAGRVSDETAFFLQGELVEVGATARIFEKPRDQRTEEYVTGKFG